MTSDQRIALAAFAVLAVLGGGIYLLVSGSGGDDGPRAAAVSEAATTDSEPPTTTESDDSRPACGSGEIEGVPIREGQHPDARACEAMDFAVRFFQASPEECAEFVSSELVADCESRGELPAWRYVGDNGVDPSFPDVVCVEFAHADGYLTVEVEQDGGAQEIVGDEC
jgi:hypothetical protein